DSGRGNLVLVRACICDFPAVCVSCTPEGLCKQTNTDTFASLLPWCWYTILPIAYCLLQLFPCGHPWFHLFPFRLCLYSHIPLFVKERIFRNPRSTEGPESPCLLMIQITQTVCYYIRI